MQNVWCVRADYGTYTKNFVQGGYVAVGYGLASSLADVTSRETLTTIYKQANPSETSNLVIGQQVGQVALVFKLKGRPEEGKILNLEEI